MPVIKEFLNIDFHHHEHLSCAEHDELEHDEVGHGHEHHSHGCSCGHCHSHEHSHSHEHGGHEECERENHAVLFWRLGISLFLLIVFMVGEKFFGLSDIFFAKIALENAKLQFLIRLVFYLVPYFIAGYDVLWSAIKNILHGELLDEEFLMAFATVGALALGEFPEAVFVMIFYQIGEFFGDYSSEKTRSSVTKLMDIASEFATIKNDKGKYEQVDPESVQIGTTIYIKPGEKIPLDGKIVEGDSTLDTSALTGESLPKSVFCNDEVFSGSINLTSLIAIETTKEYKDSTVAKILELVEHAEEKKSKAENFITKFARVYTPCVVFSALILAILPPLVIIFAKLGSYATGLVSARQVFASWIHRSLIFLVVSCPCALVISVPLAFFVGIGESAKRGILVKGSNYLEALSKTKICVFDKTGTLTKGIFSVTKIEQVNGFSKEELLKNAYICERFSTHPIAVSVINECKKLLPNIEENNLGEWNITEAAGKGIVATEKDGKKIYCGNQNLLENLNLNIQDFENDKEIGTVIYVATEEKICGKIVVSDEIKEDSAKMIRELKNIGVKETVMLTGDKKEVAENVAQKIGLDSFYAELFPEDKVDIVEEKLAVLEKNHSKSRGQLVFCGDGINDAPVLTRSDIGIAMGSLGSDSAIEASNVVIMDDDVSKIPLAIRVAKSTNKIAKENIVFSLGVKALVLILGALGFANMWLAIFADVGVCLIATVNSIRAGKVKK